MTKLDWLHRYAASKTSDDNWDKMYSHSLTLTSYLFWHCSPHTDGGAATSTAFSADSSSLEVAVATKASKATTLTALILLFAVLAH